AQIAQGLRTQATLYEIDAWKREHGAAMQTQIAHVPARIAGGSPGGLAGLQAAAKATGVPATDLLRYGAGATLGTGNLTSDQRNQKESEIGRTVAFPDGTKLYARNPAEAVTRQKAVDASQNILNAYAQLRALLQQPGRSMSLPELGQIRALV